MKDRISIVYHSGYGHTHQVADAVAQGSGGTLLQIDEHGELPHGGWERLERSRAIVFGSPTYMGNVSWQFKKFADASSKPWFAQEWKDKIAGGFTNSAGMSGDKQGVLMSLMTLATQHGMLWVSLGLMPSNTKGARRDDVNYLVGYSGPMSQSPSDAGADAMSAGDLETGRLYGKRVAEAAQRWTR